MTTLKVGDRFDRAILGIAVAVVASDTGGPLTMQASLARVCEAFDLPAPDTFPDLDRDALDVLAWRLSEVLADLATWRANPDFRAESHWKVLAGTVRAAIDEATRVR